MQLLSVRHNSALFILPTDRVLGARLGLSEHPNENHHVYGFHLTDYDNACIDAVLARSSGRSIITTMGDCGAEYR